MKNTIKCPRCKEKNLKGAEKCLYCNLIFSRLQLATNKAGKKMIAMGQKDKVIYVKEFPSDLKRWKVLLIAIFGGLFGAHHFYVGRYIKGLLMLIGGCVFLIGATLSSLSIMPEAIYTLVGLIVGILGFVWLFDILDICIRRFKVPVYIDVLEVK